MNSKAKGKEKKEEPSNKGRRACGLKTTVVVLSVLMYAMGGAIVALGINLYQSQCEVAALKEKLTRMRRGGPVRSGDLWRFPSTSNY